MADETNPETPTVAPNPGDPTTEIVPFSSPVSFDDAVTAAGSYAGTVLGIAYDNPEVSGEYYFASTQTPAEFEAKFDSSFATTPAATGLVVATTVPVGSQPAGLSAKIAPSINTLTPAFVPRPATFSPRIQKLTTRPTSQTSKVASPASVQSGDWRPAQANVYLTTYSAPNRVDISSSYWWLGADAPWLLPSDWGIEFEVNMYDPNGDRGTRTSCFLPDGTDVDYAYKASLAAQNQNLNWQVIRPDGVTAPKSLGAYADYNDLSDPCNQASFAIGLRYPQNIQGYGIVFTISAPKGRTATSIISGGTQAVLDGLCNVWPYSVGAKTDCMGAQAGDWPLGSVPHATGTLSQARGWRGPKLCWFSDQKGQVAPVNQTNDC
ncbi:hypothetical protein ACFPJ4_12820 [Lysinimonas soli]|uniref:Uncharacterized protein n=1 Tax=Lysinimonas soli TaxID=1074233 RepID=A0ABW0NSR9_9MICO